MNVEMLRHDAITPNPDQPRKLFDPDALDDLAASIRTNGLLQPITVRPAGDSTYQIVAGERRWRACGIAGIELVPCIVRALDDREAFIIATMENVARADMNPIEEANALRKLLDLGMTMQEIEDRLGMGRGQGTWKVTLLDCIDSVRHLVSRGQFSQTMAGQMAKLSPDGQQTVLREYQQRRLTQLEFTQLVNAVWAKEHNMEMFPETKVSKKAMEEAERFRAALAKVTSAAALIENIDVAQISPAIAHELGSITARLDEAVKVLSRAKSNMIRMKGREQAAMLVNGEG
ncbi:MAG: ParB/RepB/Spo0J family partition protein [Solirubrobacteraceae bacterium]